MKNLQKVRTKTGFTLVELLIVIGVIALLIGVILPNLVGVRGRARDAKRKAEMRELKTALRLYYNDYNIYPIRDPVNAPNIMGCGAAGATLCPATAFCTEYEFAAGGTGCSDTTVYMKRFPRMTSDGNDYGFEYWRAGATGDDFCLTRELENPGDKEIAVSQTRCAVACDDGGGGNYCTGNEYCMCAD